MSRTSKAVDDALNYIDTGILIGQMVAGSVREAANHHKRAAVERVRGYIHEHTAPNMPAGYIDDVKLPDSEDTSEIPPTS